MEGGGRGGRRQITATELLPTAQKNKRYAKFVFFYRSGRFLSIAGIKEALLDDVPSSSDESRVTTDSDDEPCDVEDLNYKKERQGQRRAAHR